MYKKVVCFDLDDTLYKEIDFVESAYREIAASLGKPEIVPLMITWYHEGDNVFHKLNHYLGQDKPIADYLAIYRNHIPIISLSNGVVDTLNELSHRGVILGLITDGRSISQRNKIKTLGLERWIEDKNIIISEEFGSEKTNEHNFRFFIGKYPEASFTYVGDNPTKDFVVPNQLHWMTIMLKNNGRNIHPQVDVPDEYLPQVTINEIEELIDFII